MHKQIHDRKNAESQRQGEKPQKQQEDKPLLTREALSADLSDRRAQTVEAGPQ